MNEDHTKMIGAAKFALDKATEGDELMFVLVDTGRSSKIVTNGGQGGLAHIVEVITVQIGKNIIKEKHDIDDPAYPDAYLVGSMALASRAKTRLEELKAAHESQGQPNESGGKHYSDNLTDTASANDSTGDVH